MITWPFVVILVAGFMLGGACVSFVMVALAERSRPERTKGPQNAEETLQMVAWMEEYAPATLQAWRANYTKWQQGKVGKIDA